MVYIVHYTVYQCTPTHLWSGIGCPKDVVILVDVSGSMEGLPLFLMKATFRRLVQQILSDMDYITAIKVGESGI